MSQACFLHSEVLVHFVVWFSCSFGACDSTRFLFHLFLPHQLPIINGCVSIIGRLLCIASLSPSHSSQ
ncbi:Hypothetical protein, putative [Bodo saltans]|uniref:Uncharacterized protein n=1 Tax=Bodo saltans TaxID=75058 RepID=A0A0S4IX19_BODSA|nr:Hypothetical protein, putative [Bodo saltans]|eukprot:CUG35442.1 Hypothetical protein, putative [Bodo saltans]